MSRLLGLMGLRAAANVETLDDLRAGPVRAVGTLQCAAPITSPIHKRQCAGYYYHASHLGWRTVGPSTRKTLLRAIVYAPSLTLTLDAGGEVECVPKPSDRSNEVAHERLATRDLPGFLAKETLLRDGERVLVYGTAKLVRDRWTIAIDQVVKQTS